MAAFYDPQQPYNGFAYNPAMDYAAYEYGSLPLMPPYILPGPAPVLSHPAFLAHPLPAQAPSSGGRHGYNAGLRPSRGRGRGRQSDQGEQLVSQLAALHFAPELLPSGQVFRVLSILLVQCAWIV